MKQTVLIGLVCLATLLVMPVSATVLNLLPADSARSIREGSIDGAPIERGASTFLVGRSSNQGAPNPDLLQAYAVYNFDVSSISPGSTINNSTFFITLNSPMNVGFDSCFDFVTCPTLLSVTVYGVWRDSVGDLSLAGYAVLENVQMPSVPPSEVVGMATDSTYLIERTINQYGKSVVQFFVTDPELSSWTSQDVGGAVVSGARLIIDYTAPQNVVPEPDILLLLSIGIIGIGYQRRRSKKAAQLAKDPQQHPSMIRSRGIY